MGPYISFDPRTGFLTFKAPQPPAAQSRDASRLVSEEGEDSVANAKTRIATTLRLIREEEAKSMVDVDFVESLKNDLEFYRGELARLEGTRVIDVTVSPPPAAPQRNDAFAVPTVLSYDSVKNTAHEMWGLNPHIDAQENEIHRRYTAFFNAYNDFFLYYGSMLKRKLQSDLRANNPIELIQNIALQLLVQSSILNPEYGIFYHVARAVYEKDYAKANALQDILVDLMQQFQDALEAGRLAPRAAESKIIQLYTLEITLAVPPLQENVGFTEHSMGVYNWDSKIPVAFVGNKGQKTSELNSILEDDITRDLLPASVWRITYPFALGNKWSTYTKNMLFRNDLPNVTTLKATTKKNPELDLRPIGSISGKKVYMPKKGDYKLEVLTQKTKSDQYSVAFAVYSSTKKKKVVTELVGIYVFIKP